MHRDLGDAVDLIDHDDVEAIETVLKCQEFMDSERFPLLRDALRTQGIGQQLDDDALKALALRSLYATIRTTRKSPVSRAAKAVAILEVLSGDDDEEVAKELPVVPKTLQSWVEKAGAADGDTG